jgi:phage tail sheath protein FI
MPTTYTYPGIYVEEIPSGVRPITGVSTSDTAFIDFFARGPINEATRVTSLEDFNRKFGGLSAQYPANSQSEAAYAINQYYLNGGSVAWVVRIAAGSPAPAVLTLDGGSPAQPTLDVEAANPGLWGLNLQVAIDADTRSPDLFNLVVRELSLDKKTVLASEIRRNLSMDQTSAQYALSVINGDSDLIRLVDRGLGDPPTPTGTNVTKTDAITDASNSAFKSFTTGASDGTVPDAAAFIAALTAGTSPLDRIAPFIFNILCIPAVANLDDASYGQVLDAARKFCEDKRAFLIVDIPEKIDKPSEMENTWMPANDTRRSKNAAVYFPRLEMLDPLNAFRFRNVGPSGTLAGVYARTDSTRGVWKAPAGTEATLSGARLPAKLTDLENGPLNQLGVNVLRTFPIFGGVSWGGRTMQGADQIGSEWKYIPVRRTALYIEESLFQALKWVVFEPNDEPLWSQIRLNVGAFMHDLFRQGAFQGKTPRDAYFVKCDSETTTQTDIDKGIVNILVGFAPLKPAEFVVLKIEQMAGQIQT